MTKTLSDEAVVVFKTKLAEYKKMLDEDIEEYSKKLQTSILQNYGANSRVAADAYVSVLSRGGKRIRGSLVMLGYEMCGGKDTAMALQAARAVEMVHAYVLIIDDINDRSVVRRGGSSAHAMLADHYTKHNYGTDAQHFGESIAMNAALMGGHHAQVVMATLPVDEQRRLKALTILNQGLVVTVHGQFNDLFNQVAEEVTEHDVVNVTEWKTAHYTFLNPLHIGMSLAGADDKTMQTIHEYAMKVGQAFQITDDILGTFGGEFEIGKSPLDDIREGKRTLLALYALEHTSAANKNFLIQMLGNQDLTQAEFQRCKDIFVESGALEYTRKQADGLITEALRSLDALNGNWDKSGTQFLRGLAEYLLVRHS